MDRQHALGLGDRRPRVDGLLHGYPATKRYLELVALDTMMMPRATEIPAPASRKAANARSLYLEGIRDGDMRRALAAYIGDHYTQHSTG